MKTTIKGYAVFKIPTKEARIFAGRKPERVSQIYDECNEDLYNVLQSFQMGGCYDELTAGYFVQAVQ